MADTEGNEHTLKYVGAELNYTEDQNGVPYTWDKGGRGISKKHLRLKLGM